jgi:hypothetical protein
LQNAENRYDQEEPFEALTPEKIFDARWAMALLGEARRRLSLEYSAQPPACTTPTSPPCFIWGEAVRITSMQWNL